MNNLIDILRQTFEVSHSQHTTIRAMEGIRGLAVFLVFLTHFVALLEPWIQVNSNTGLVASYLQSMGDVGVDLFFVLSGYLIYGMLIRKYRPFNGYILRRIQRIYPTFIVVFIIYLLLSVVFPEKSKLPDGWENSLLYIAQNFILLPGIFNIEPIIRVSWSLSYEFFYYLLIPALISILSLRLWPPQLRIIFFVIISFISFFYTFFYGDGHYMRLLMFVSGIILFEVVENKLIKKVPPVGFISLLLAMFLVYWLKDIGADSRFKHLSLYFLFFILCLESFISTGILTQFFTNKFLRWFGNMSYSYYLFHGLTIQGFVLVLSKIHPPTATDTGLIWLLLPVVFLLTIVTSAVLFVSVEKPYSLVKK